MWANGNGSISSLCHTTQDAQDQGLKSVYVGSHWLTRKEEVERAMGIENTAPGALIFLDYGVTR